VYFKSTIGNCRVAFGDLKFVVFAAKGEFTAKPYADTREVELVNRHPYFKLIQDIDLSVALTWIDSLTDLQLLRGRQLSSDRSGDHEIVENVSDSGQGCVHPILRKSE